MKIRSRGASVLMAAALLGLAGCAGGGDNNKAAPPAAPETTAAPESSAMPTTGESSPAAGSVDLKTAKSSLGEIVVDGKGMTVYYFTKDKKDSGVSNCTGDCIVAWPPVLTESDSPKVDGVTAKIGTIKTPEGKKQITIDGMPVYYWQKDTKPGDVTGQDVNEVWYVVAPDGTMIR
jgi:predicted lipoprotein with Yx(FWY)xxD motif